MLVKQDEMERAVALAGPDARLVVIPGAGHLLPLERPAEVEREVLPVPACRRGVTHLLGETGGVQASQGRV